MKQKIITKKGFTLVEVIVATALFAFFIGSVVAAMLADAHNGPVNERRLQAANLARDGLEQVTQIRDTVWLRGGDWAGLGACGAIGPSLQIRTKPAGSTCLADKDLTTGDEPITLESKTFTRKIEIQDSRIFEDDPDPGNNTKLIIVKVEWDEGGEAKFIEMKKMITNWKAI